MRPGSPESTPVWLGTLDDAWIQELKTLLDHVADGRLKPAIDRTFPLQEARAAVQYVLDRKNKGKALLIPDTA